MGRCRRSGHAVQLQGAQDHQNLASCIAAEAESKNRTSAVPKQLDDRGLGERFISSSSPKQPFWIHVVAAFNENGHGRKCRSNPCLIEKELAFDDKVPQLRWLDVQLQSPCPRHRHVVAGCGQHSPRPLSSVGPVASKALPFSGLRGRWWNWGWGWASCPRAQVGSNIKLLQEERGVSPREQDYQGAGSFIERCPGRGVCGRHGFRSVYFLVDVVPRERSDSEVVPMIGYTE
mmetsp:Transcript_39420/g.73980  ORF Transcript_39420/g.73980 Transcript_39420/m.73980 type:complete len:232 (+) Transcript_39420:463-1158(+)